MIGDPVTTVRTPRLLEGRLAADGIAADVEVRRVPASGVDTVMRALRADDTVDGMMVTMPHKRAVIAHLDAISSTALLVGSVNAVKRTTSGAFVGAQFDGVALVRALAAAGADVAGQRVLLLGFGGAGVAIAHAIMHRGCAALAIGDPGIAPDDVSAAIERLHRGAVGTAATVWDGGGVFDILVNATPLGMRPKDPSPFTPDQVAAASGVADIVADPPQTRLAALAEQSGRLLVSGRDMVRAQIDPIATWLMSETLDQ